MKKRDYILILMAFAIFTLYSCKNEKNESFRLLSPDKKNQVHFLLKNGKAYYYLQHKNTRIIDTSGMGFELEGNENFGALELIKSSVFSQTAKWNPVYGQQKTIEDNYNQILFELKEKSGKQRKISIEFRAYNEGIGFRYIFPEQKDFLEFKIKNELSEFNFAADATAWWFQTHYDSYEILYNKSKISEIRSTILNKKTLSENELYMKNDAAHLPAINTPASFVFSDSLLVAIHEAALIDYAEMSLLCDSIHKTKFTSTLTPYKNGVKVLCKTPIQSPWRVIMIAQSAAKLAESNLILNFNEPCKIEETSWIKPFKYIGIWWGYHVGKYSWDYPGTPKNPHGANTENAMKHIDFAAKYKIPYLLVEGWNAKLDSVNNADASVSQISADLRSYTTSHPDYDLEKVVAYAKSKGVKIIIHNETMGQVGNYENQMEKAYQYYNQLGIDAIKTGYAWYIENGKFYHSGQWMVNHFNKTVSTAAKYKIMLDVHECIKPTGLMRTWPNLMTQEGQRGNEYNAWDKAHGNPPAHTTILPFTWMLAGYMDFTPGIFDITFDKYKKEQRVNTTIAHQLALYVVLYSPWQMAADLIENYENHPCFQFIMDVPVNWDESHILDGKIGEYIITARKSGEDWYLGSITNENSRKLQIGFNFLDSNLKYKAQIYADSKETDLKSAPEKYQITNIEVTQNTIYEANLSAGGGLAIRITPEK